MELDFTPPSNYFYMRRLQAIQIAADAYTKIAGIDVMSKTWTLKNIMGLTDNEVLEQYRMRKLEAAHEYEIAQITSAGPNWKAAALMQSVGSEAAGGNGGGDAGGMDLGGGDAGGGDGLGLDGGFGSEDFGETMDNADSAMEDNPGGGMEAL